MPIVILLLGTATTQVIGKVDVAWSVQIVTSDERGWQLAQAAVRDVVPHGAHQQQGMQPNTAVRSGDAVACTAPPRGDHALDRTRIDAGPVAQHDDGRIDLVAERG
ncbi:MAG TPA: hypothetical protein VKB64_07405, partial [Gaiellaceae bacterium]|nr:hypothetical protein [Gaiellaceae bacterium]